MKALLDAILANPGDVAVRRVYADALLDAGEPLGELMHIQLDLATPLPRADAIARRRRAAAMVRTHWRRWLDGLEGVFLGVPTWRGGFITEAAIDPRVLAARADEILARAPLLTRFELCAIRERGVDEHVKAVETLLASPRAARFHGLRFSYSNISSSNHHWEDKGDWITWREFQLRAVLAAQARLTNLVALDVSLARDGDERLVMDSGLLRQLERFDFGSHFSLLEAASDQLRSARFESYGFEPILLNHRRVRALEELELTAHVNTAVDFPPLRRLKLYSSARDIVGSIAYVPTLVELDLETDFHNVHALENARLDSLRVFRFRRWMPPTDDLLRLFTIPWVERCEHVDLSACGLTADVASQIAERFDGLLTTEAQDGSK